MAPFRNPFGRKPQTGNGVTVQQTSEQSHPLSNELAASDGATTTEQKRPSAININAKGEPEEFKLGVVDGNGAYLPPSPPEKKAFWRRTPTSSTHDSSHLAESDGFSISRESFDSYRRSFDISARSPIVHSDSTFSTYSRQSLDSSRTPYSPRFVRQNSGKSLDLPRSIQSSHSTLEEEEDHPRSQQTNQSLRQHPYQQPQQQQQQQEQAAQLKPQPQAPAQQRQRQQAPPAAAPPPHQQDVFEDVGLNDEGAAGKSTTAKRGLFSRIMNSESGDHGARPGSNSQTGHKGLHLPGRKRGQSGQGAELGDMPRPGSKGIGGGGGGIGGGVVGPLKKENNPMGEGAGVVAAPKKENQVPKIGA